MTDTQRGERNSAIVDLWIRLDQPALGAALLLLRKHAGLSRPRLIDDVALFAKGDDVRLVESLVYRWEMGPSPRPRPSYYYRELLGRVCESRVERMEPVSRREFMQNLAALAGVPVFNSILGLDPELLAFAGPVDGHFLDGLMELTASYARVHNTVAPRAVEEALKAHLDQLMALTVRVRVPSLTPQVLSIAAQTAILSGWVSFNLQDLGKSVSRWMLVCDLAREAGNPNLQAHAVACRSRLYSPIHSPQVANASRALEMLDGAVELMDAAASPPLRSWVHAGRAQQLAALHRDAEAYRELDAAAGWLSKGSGEEIVIAHWNDTRLDAYRAICALELRQPRKVVDLLEPMLERTSPSLVPRCLQLSDLAAAHAAQREIERACGLLGQAHAMAGELGFAEGIQRVNKVRQHYLPPAATSAAVRRLDEQLGRAMR